MNPNDAIRRHDERKTDDDGIDPQIGCRSRRTRRRSSCLRRDRYEPCAGRVRRRSAIAARRAVDRRTAAGGRRMVLQLIYSRPPNRNATPARISSTGITVPKDSHHQWCQKCRPRLPVSQKSPTPTRRTPQKLRVATRAAPGSRRVRRCRRRSATASLGIRIMAAIYRQDAGAAQERQQHPGHADERGIDPEIGGDASAHAIDHPVGTALGEPADIPVAVVIGTSS